MAYVFRDINEGFKKMVRIFWDAEKDKSDHVSRELVAQDSRNGPVVRSTRPVTITYTEAVQNKVLFSLSRDCNPFFHFYEAMWMLAGRNDLGSLIPFISNFGQYSDDGLTLHGAYGFRWRKWFGYDQLQVIIDELKENPNSRRCVLQMWDANANAEPDEVNPTVLENGLVTGRHDLYTATHGGRDVPCNIACTFNVINGYLHMSVFNRSNDLVLGSMGANYVHFAFLLEYVANCLGLHYGTMSQVSSNLHAYTEHASWKPQAYLNDQTGSLARDFAREYQTARFEQVAFDQEVKYFANDPTNSRVYKSPVLDHVGKPMMKAFFAHKERLYDWAIKHCEQIKAIDWKVACANWINKRKDLWEAKQRKPKVKAGRANVKVDETIDENATREDES